MTTEDVKQHVQSLGQQVQDHDIISTELYGPNDDNEGMRVLDFTGSFFLHPSKLI